MRKLNWLDLEPVDAPTGMKFHLDNTNSLWYCQLDYGPFLRQQLVTLANKDRVVTKDRVEKFLNEYGPL